MKELRNTFANFKHGASQPGGKPGGGHQAEAT